MGRMCETPHWLAFLIINYFKDWLLHLFLTQQNLKTYKTDKSCKSNGFYSFMILAITHLLNQVNRRVESSVSEQEIHQTILESGNLTLELRILLYSDGNLVSILYVNASYYCDLTWVLLCNYVFCIINSLTMVLVIRPLYKKQTK